MTKKKLIVGNWKMNPETAAEARTTFTKIKTKAAKLKNADTVICPPSLFLGDLRKLVTGKRCVLGAQNCHAAVSGAHTGEISAVQIASMKVPYVILGHSERRAAGEGDEDISQKIKAAMASGLKVILCVGEEKRDRDGKYLRTVEMQLLNDLSKIAKTDLSQLVIAYEPIWAIGKNALRPATPGDVFEMKIFVKRVLTDKFGKENADQTMFLYGGSVDDKNTEEFLGDGQADGLLVGRASLSAEIFGKIMEIGDRVAAKK
ncbi:MAG TPA: triose-phosphate isomerase [Candidatus Paceibacterota bacterium]|nr:triose-phosphate isomerase [Candidatus Paceibacterota bacterium]